MRPMSLVAAVLLGAGLLACLGPYPGIGDKLDGTALVNGTSYIALDGGAARILVIAPLDGGSSAPFTRVDERQPRAVETLQGTWSGSDARLDFATSTVFRLPDEASKSVGSRTGASRQQVSPPKVSSTTVGTVTGDTLVLLGAPEVAASYRSLLSRTARISGPDTTACAFHVANLAVESSEARVPGFNSAGMTQYLNREELFQGILSGSMTVGLVGLFSPVSTIRFTNYADFDGVVLNGVQISSTNTSGDGALSGVLGFRIQREGLPPLEGSVDYGQVSLTTGNESGDYLVTLDGGTTVRVPTGRRVPPLEQCLGM